MRRSRSLVVEQSTALGAVTSGITNGQSYFTLKSKPSIQPYDSETANALYTEAEAPNVSGTNPLWQQLVTDFFANSSSVIIEKILASATRPSSGSYLGVLVDDQKMISDVVVPGFRKRSAKGEVFNNPMLTVHTKLVGGISSTSAPAPKVTLTFMNGTQGSVNGRDRGYRNPQGNMAYFPMWKMLVRWTIDWSASSVVVAPQSVLTRLNDLPIKPLGYQNALNTAYGNINAAALELLTVAVEGKSTLSHLVSTGVKLAQLISNIKRGNFTTLAPKTYQKWKSGGFGPSALKNSPQVTGDAWLEARYAWTPLVLDAAAAVSLLTGSSYAKRKTFRGKESGSTSYEVSQSWTEGGLQFTLTGLVTVDQSIRVGHLCESRFDSPVVSDFGLTNIVGAIKEAIPWSFVVEWFINISGLMYRMNPSPAYVILASWVTRNSILDFHGQVEVSAPSGFKQSVPIRYIRTRKDREPIDSPANVTFNTRLNVARLIDTFAFLRNVGR